MTCAFFSRPEDHFTNNAIVGEAYTKAKNPRSNYYKTSQRPTNVFHKTTTLAKGNKKPAAAVAKIMAATTKTSEEKVNELRITTRAALTDCPLNAELRCVL